MSGFSKEWLSLREPLDLAARNHDVEAAFCAELPRDGCRILDLGSGAGSTVAALSPVLPGPVEWILADHDPGLLRVAENRLYEPQPITISLQEIDLAKDLEQLPFAEVDAVTTSAFLDLVSADFLTRLVACVVTSKKPFLASLSYDGRMSLAESNELDDDVRLAVNHHQTTDKGFGPALGPQAAGRATELFRSSGYRVVEGWSNWDAGSLDGGFLTELLSGCVRVAGESGLEAHRLDQWWDMRQGQIADGSLSVSVGHVDFVAML